MDNELATEPGMAEKLVVGSTIPFFPKRKSLDEGMKSTINPALNYRRLRVGRRPLKILDSRFRGNDGYRKFKGPA